MIEELSEVVDKLKTQVTDAGTDEFDAFNAILYGHGNKADKILSEMKGRATKKISEIKEDLFA